MGKPGPDGAQIEVIDRPAETALCLGIQGPLNEARMSDAMTVLDDWLKAHASEWKEAGPPRRLGYHGPMTPGNRKLWELQVPIKPVVATVK